MRALRLTLFLALGANAAPPDAGTPGEDRVIDSRGRFAPNSQLKEIILAPAPEWRAERLLTRLGAVRVSTSKLASAFPLTEVEVTQQLERVTADFGPCLPDAGVEPLAFEVSIERSGLTRVEVANEAPLATCIARVLRAAVFPPGGRARLTLVVGPAPTGKRP